MAKTYDVVIVGAGLSGFAAAARAADKNLTTLLLEKSAHTGGSGNYVEGVFAAGSTIQKAAGVHVDQQAVLQTELDYSHYEANHDMWRKYIAQSGQNIDWLQAHGVQFTGVATLGKGSQTWHLFAGHGAQAIHQGLEPFVQRAGVTITTAVDITSITKDDDQFTIAFTHQQQIITVTAKNVILATGGYLNNPAMMDHTAPTGKNTILPMNAGKSHGDGLKFAWKLGAQPFFTGMKMRFGAQLADPNVPPYKLWGATLAKLVVRAQPLLWVNESGDRFVNEDHVIDNWSSQGNVINRQERVFVILDQAMIDQLSTTKLIKKMHFDYSHQTIPELKETVATAIAKHRAYLTVADSMAALQQKISAPALTATIARYNQLATQHQDVDFGKPAQYLFPIEQGPFYAIEVGCGAYTTGDGLKVNGDHEVLAANGQAISGLYAIGSDGSAIMYGDTYGVEIPGSHAGFCVFSGIHAVDHLATTIK